jgi:hypothetical protein
LKLAGGQNIFETAFRVASRPTSASRCPLFFYPMAEFVVK